MRLHPLVILLTATTIHAQVGKPGELFTARHGANGTWNLYQTSNAPLSWSKAQELAVATLAPVGGSEKPGHLITISSAAENLFAYHYPRGGTIWIGLTDNEKFPGASEAGSAQDRGWAWVTGEPVTYTNWQSTEPLDNAGAEKDDKGEDGVAIEKFGRWNDRPMGAHDQQEVKFPFMIEWDLQSAEPVPGARVIAPVLPAQWPVLEVMPDDEAKSGPWVCVQTSQLPGDARIEVLTKHLEEHWKEKIPYRILNAHFQMAMGDPHNSFGWIFSPAIDFPGQVTNNFGLLARARLMIPKAGTYTFSVHADDAFALRLGSNKWKSSQGRGAIDAADGCTLFSDLLISDSDTRGVMDLPAGEIPIEIFYVNGGVEGMLQILTAEGEHLDEGSTDRWRILGHKPKGKVPWPGVTAAGWKVTIPVPGAERKVTLQKDFQEAMIKVDAPGSAITEGLDSIHFCDPECARRTRFPGAVPFPGDLPGAQDDRVVLAEATLVIPVDGTYNIGIAGDDVCALQIKDQKWGRIVFDGAGRCARVDEDSLFSRRTTTSSSQECIGEIKLTRGSYAIRAVSWDRNGTSNFEVFAAPAGFPGRLLSKEKAGEGDDLPSLEVLPFKP